VNASKVIDKILSFFSGTWYIMPDSAVVCFILLKA